MCLEISAISRAPYFISTKRVAFVMWGKEMTETNFSNIID